MNLVQTCGLPHPSLAVAVTCVFLAITFPAHSQSEQVIRFNGGSADNAYSVTTDSAGNILVGGSVTKSGEATTFAVVKHNPQGVVQWVSHFRTSADLVGGIASALTTDAAGNVYAAGYVARPLPFLQQN